MNFTGIINEIIQDPQLELKASYKKIKMKLNTVEKEKKSDIVAEYNISREIDIKDWDNTEKDKYMRILVDLYINLIDDMYNKINNITGTSLEECEPREKYMNFL